LTRSGSRFRPTIYRTQGQHANYYTTDVILTWKEVVVVVLFKKRNKHTSHANCKPRNFYLMCFLCMFAYSDDQYFAVVHLFGILCCVFCFVYLRSVCCVPNVLFIFVLCVVYPMFCLSSFCVLCTRCFVYLRSVCCVPNVASFSWWALRFSLTFICLKLLHDNKNSLISNIFRSGKS
jgi:hypothetical protein